MLEDYHNFPQKDQRDETQKHCFVSYQIPSQISEKKLILLPKIFFVSHLPHPFNAGISAAVILLKIPHPQSLRVTSIYFLLTMSPLNQMLTLNAQNLIVNSPL